MSTERKGRDERGDGYTFESGWTQGPSSKLKLSWLGGWRKFALIALLIVAPGLTNLAPRAPAQADGAQNTIVPVHFTVFNPCAGEAVDLSGAAYLMAQVTTDTNGGTHVVTHFNYQGLSGTGLTSGKKYRLSDADQSVFNTLGPPPLEFTVVSTFELIGQGPGNNFLIHFTGHVTVNAKGEVTADVINAREGECR